MAYNLESNTGGYTKDVLLDELIVQIDPIILIMEMIKQKELWEKHRIKN